MAPLDEMMNKAVPWSIKGVGFDAREAAKEAARRSGMTLGEWLNSVIAEQAAEMGVDAEDIDADERLEAVAARLQRMGERETSKASRRRNERSGRDAPRSRPTDEDLREVRFPIDEDDDFYAETPRRARRREAYRDQMAPEMRQRPANDAFLRDLEGRDDYRRRASMEAESMLENAIEALERQAFVGQKKTARALANVAQLIESTESRRSSERETLEAVAQRLNDIEAQISRKPDDAIRPIKGALARLEERLDSIGRRASAPAQDYGDYGPSDALSARGQRSIGDAIAEISRRQRVLDAPTSVANDRFDPNAGMARGGDLGRRLDSVARRPAAPAPVMNPMESPLADLQKDVVGLARLIEDLRKDSQHREELQRVAVLSAKAAAPQDGIENLRNDIAQLTRSLSDLAPRGSVSALESAIQGLSQRIETSRTNNDGNRSQALETVDKLAQDLRRSLTELDPRPGVASLEREVRTIAQKLDNLSAPGIDPSALDTIQNQTREIRDLLSAAAARPMPIDKIEQQVAALSDRMERMTSEPAKNGNVDHFVADLRQLLNKTMPGAALQNLEDKLENLSRKIDDAVAATPVQDTGALEDVMRSLNERLQQSPTLADNSGLEKMVRSLADRLESMGRPQDTSGLEKLVRSLADKIENASQPNADVSAIEALERQVAKMAERIERSDNGASVVNTLDRSIKDLFGQIEGLRASAFDAAQTAARSAARDTLREVLENAPKASAASPEISREIADLRSMQDAVDRRTNTTLNAVHETLEKVVDRLAMLEGDLAEARVEAPPAAAPVFAPAPAAPTFAPPAAAVAHTPAPAFAPPATQNNHAAQRATDAPQFQPAAVAVAEPRSSLDVRPDFAPALDLAAPPVAPAQSAPNFAPANVTAAVAPQRTLSTALDDDDDFLLDPGSSFAPRRADAAPAAAHASARGDVKVEAATEFAPAPSARMAPAEPENPKSAQASFIAAARRAAQAAQSAETESAPQPRGKRPTIPAMPSAADAAKAAGSKLDLARNFINAKKRPIVLSIAGLVTLALTYQLLNGPDDVPVTPAAPANVTKPAVRAIEPSPSIIEQTPAAPALAPAQPSSVQQPATPQAPSANAPAKPGANPSLTPLPGAVGPRASALDASPVASINDRPASSAVAALDPRASAPNGNLAELAKKGVPAAQFELGSRFAEGRSVTRDYKEAAKWFENAATQGLAPAQYRLGSLYEKGLGVQRDAALARTWYLRAADAGNARAMHNLAVLTAEGVDGKPDYASAGAWFRKAAEHGIRDSQFNLAILHARGLGVQQSLVQSYVWFALAAAQGDEDAGRKRDEVGARLDANDLTTAKAAVASFKPKGLIPAANDVAMPAGGWKNEPAADVKPAMPARPKISRL